MITLHSILLVDDVQKIVRNDKLGYIYYIR